MMASSCPICHISLPSDELPWHANNHFVEDDLISDMRLAQQIALIPESSTSMVTCADFVLEDVGRWSPEHSFSRSDCNSSDFLARTYGKSNSSCIKLQKRAIFYKVEGGIMSLLEKCLELENKNTSVVTGYIDHYQSTREDNGWGCGWHNIQMLSSHLIAQRKEVRDVIFGGCEFVPDIPSLQSWLEMAWKKGFDIPGANSFGHKVHGSKKWIGTTECAALLRSFGLRAKVVDFDGKVTSSLTKSVKNSQEERRNNKAKGKQIYGPMDKFLTGKRQHHLVSDVEAAANVHGLSSIGTSNNMDQEMDKFACKIVNPQILANWVWKYFTDSACCGSSSSQNVLISPKTPLYFQHDGHSRTIVGVQRLKELHGLSGHYTLLILDPGQRTAALEKALRENSGWQRFIKRGVHTLQKSQYQLCYVDPGIACDEELNQLKTIDSHLVEI